MKKVTVFLCSLALVFSVVGVAGAFPILDTQSLGGAIVEGFTDPFLLGEGFSEVTEGIISDATLEISGDEIDSDQNEDAVLKIVVANLTTDAYSGLYLSSSEDLYLFNNSTSKSIKYVYRAPGVSGPGVSGPGVSRPGVSRPGVSGPGASGPGANGPAPVPEPSTILLMGAGLLGIVAVGRRKFNRKE